MSFAVHRFIKLLRFQLSLTHDLSFSLFTRFKYMRKATSKSKTVFLIHYFWFNCGLQSVD